MRGFFSAIVFAIITFILITSVATVYSIQGREEAMITQLIAAKVGQRRLDAIDYFNKTIVDAIVDTVYESCGCSGAATNPIPYYNRMNDYFDKSSKALSQDGIRVSYSLSVNGFARACSEPDNAIIYYSANIFLRGVNASITQTQNRRVWLKTYSDSNKIEIGVSDYPSNAVFNITCS